MAIPNLPIGASGNPLVFIVCPRCGHDHTETDCEDWTPVGPEVDVCSACGFSQLDPPPWLDEPDPSGKRPAEWAVAKGYLILGDAGGLDPAWLPAGFIKASTLRVWPRGDEFPDYRITEATYDAAMAAIGDPFPVRMRGRTV